MFKVLEFMQHTAVLVGCRVRCDESVADYKICYKENPFFTMILTYIFRVVITS